MDALLHSGLLQRALVEAVVLGAVCGPLGVWLLHVRQAYAAESLSHAMLPGLVLASVAGAPLVLGAGGGVLAAAALLTLAARDRRVGPELAVGVTVTAVFGLGVVLAQARDVPARLGELLFGDLLATSASDLAIAAALAAGVGLALAAAHRALSVAVFDPVAARSLGVRPARVELGLLALLALATVAAVQALGNLLVFALIVAPAAAGLRLGRSLPGQLAVAGALGAAAGAAGMVLSAELDTAAGPTVALCAVAPYALAAVLRPGGRERAGALRRSPIEALGAPR
jgi:ABC-type Mn2+/Zn2+ transport system permease subunit